MAEGGGTTAHDIATFRDLTAQGGVFLGSRGGFGGPGISINGSSQYLDASNWILGGTDLTVLCWVYTSTSNQNCMLVEHEPVNGDWELFVEVGQLKIRGGSTTEVDGGTLDINSWRQCAATITGTSAKLYYEGNNVASGSVSAVANATNTLNIGRYSGSGGGYYFNGLYDHVMIWNRALKPEEILILFREPFAFIQQAPPRRIIFGPSTPNPDAWLNREQVVSAERLSPFGALAGGILLSTVPHPLLVASQLPGVRTIASVQPPPPYAGVVWASHAWPVTAAPEPPGPGRQVASEPPPPFAGMVYCGHGWTLSLPQTVPNTMARSEEPPPYPGRVLSAHAWEVTAAPQLPGPGTTARSEEPPTFPGSVVATSAMPPATPLSPPPPRAILVRAEPPLPGQGLAISTRAFPPATPNPMPGVMVRSEEPPRYAGWVLTTSAAVPSVPPQCPPPGRVVQSESQQPHPGLAITLHGLPAAITLSLAARPVFAWAEPPAPYGGVVIASHAWQLTEAHQCSPYRYAPPARVQILPGRADQCT